MRHNLGLCANILPLCLPALLVEKQESGARRPSFFWVWCADGRKVGWEKSGAGSPQALLHHDVLQLT